MRLRRLARRVHRLDVAVARLEFNARAAVRDVEATRQALDSARVTFAPPMTSRTA